MATVGFEGVEEILKTPNAASALSNSVVNQFKTAAAAQLQDGNGASCASMEASGCLTTCLPSAALGVFDDCNADGSNKVVSAESKVTAEKPFACEILGTKDSSEWGHYLRVSSPRVSGPDGDCANTAGASNRIWPAGVTGLSCYARLALTDVSQTYSKLLAMVWRVSFDGVADNGCFTHDLQ